MVQSMLKEKITPKEFYTIYILNKFSRHGTYESQELST